jgi:hypothetical protein
MSDSQKETGYCKLGPDLVISYNGCLVESIPKVKSRIIGTILTRHGELISRNSKCDKWQYISSPSIYLFFDNDTCILYKVDTCECKIQPSDFIGRILDCTDRIIYEVACGNKRTPVCDLGDRQNETVILCNSVPIGETTVCFKFPGENPVISCFSEISACDVLFECNTALVTFPLCGHGSLPPSGCAVLLFTVCCDGENITIAKIFTREPASAIRFSAQSGTISDTAIITPITTFLGSCLVSPSLALGSLARAFPIITWSEIYDKPTSTFFNPVTGVVNVIKSADYEINAQFSYCSPFIPNFIPVINVVGETLTVNIVLRTAVPYFALLRNGTIVNVAPVTANLIPATPISLGLPVTSAGLTNQQILTILLGLNIIFLPIGFSATQILDAILSAIYALPPETRTYDLQEVGESTLNIDLSLNTTDILQTIFVDPLAVTIGPDLGMPTTYTLIPLGTTFNVKQIL